MKGEESPKRTIHRPLVLSITSTVREKCEKKQGTQPVQRTEREVMLLISPKSWRPPKWPAGDGARPDAD